MKKIVEDIAIQAGWHDWTDDDNWIHPLAQDRGYIILADLEKFAGLVIDECVTTLKAELDPDTSDTVSIILKSRFGAI